MKLIFKELMKEYYFKLNMLSHLIDKYLIPQENEKKKNAEVSTPYKLRQEMIGILDKNFFKSKKKVFEPCSGKGGFLIDIIDQFMKELDIPDEELKYKTIVEECLYFSDINPTNIFINKLLIDPHNKYKLNYNEGDTLKLNIKEKWNLDNFDLVIGNPPYNKEFNAAGASPLYNEFIEFLIPLCSKLILIIPSRWFSGGKGLDKFRKMMLNRKDIVMIKHFKNSKEVFGNFVNIAGGVNYFLIDKNYNGQCNFNNNLINLNKYDILVEGKYYDLIEKLSKYDNITTIYRGRYYNIESNDKRLTDNDNLIKCYVSKQKGFIKYIDGKYINDNYKIITSRANGNNNCFGNIFIGSSNEVHSGSYISFKVNNEDEAKSLLSYLKCKLPNLMLSIRKISQHISEKTIKFIPLPPLNRIWNDNEIYSYFNLDENETKLINETKLKGYK